MKTIALILAVWGLMGCVPTWSMHTERITLRHPDGRHVTCGPYDASYGRGALAAVQETNCLSDYQRQGFERAPK